MEHGIPLFLDQLIKTLRLEGTRDPISSQEVSGPSGGEEPVLSEMGITAMQHGADLLRQGFTVDQVVHDYGDLCQAITEMAFDKGMAIEVNEFRTLNRCLDNAIAGAVTEFSCRRESAATEKQTKDQNQRLGIFAHEMRNLLYSASLALAAIKSGGVGLNGATGAVLDRSLVGLSHLIDRSLAEVRMTAEMPPRRHTFSLGDFIEDIRLTAALEAKLKECRLVVEVKNPKLPLNADREMLMAAVGNLLQNAFKFTRRNTEVTLA
ncbi:MAG: sensor histidine kinase, partial [Verrucomicrobium sp.]